MRNAFLLLRNWIQTGAKLEDENPDQPYGWKRELLSE